ncbi:retron St85 family effector protein [Hydrogenovibrio halophilus]|uniref:retron St85 family effector protein n=1 Tax=Hydrogenovibrio halophilus TaxID=373391 RepID=UPI0012FDCAE6|nr:retron St85 family effector protein [Hydrogenovibrio halophilus]
MSDANIDPRNQFIDSLNLDKSQVFFEPYHILLFGGKAKTQTDEAGPRSFREKLNGVLTTQGPSFLTIYPESFQDWLHDAIYDDLIEFQTDLSLLSSVIIVILEGPGSLAELGTFVMDNSIIPRFFVVVESTHCPENAISYIQMGPLRKLQPDKVLVYDVDFKVLDDNTQNDFALDDIFSTIKAFLEGINKSEALDRNHKGHVAFLIKELVALFYALTFQEIVDYLNALEIPHSQKSLKRLLFVMEKIDLIFVKQVGSTKYYISSEMQSRIRFSFLDGKFDRPTVEMEVMSFYTDINDGKRLFALKGEGQ